MSKYQIKKKSRRTLMSRETFIAPTTLVLFIIALIFSKQISLAVIDGMKLAAFSIIPSIFPFFILSDMLRSLPVKENSNCVSRVTKRLLGINSSELGAFLCGNICGFPIGVGYASNLYIEGKISKERCERLIGISSNPSIAFVISGVGVGLLGSLNYGILLYASIITATLITGALFKIDGKSINTDEKIKQSFDLVVSIKNAAYSSISVSAYIIFFSTIIGIISSIINSAFATAVISIFLEVGNASKLLSNIVFLPSNISLALIAFSLAFSGISVHMQSRSVLHEDISMRTYYKMKLCEGVIAFLIVALIQPLLTYI